MVIGITPQWPLVVTAVSVQAPSKRGALIAGRLDIESSAASAPGTKERRLAMALLLLKPN
jgi:hypothetical protein